MEHLRNTGCFEDPIKSKDYHYEDLIAVGAVDNQVDWEIGFDIEDSVSLKRESQNGSLSCVGQATSKIGEVLNFLETQELVDFSAKRIYSNIRLENGGAYTAKACQFVIDNGFLPERLDPSYNNGQPPTEDFIKEKKELTEEEKKLEKYYGALRYFYIDSFGGQTMENLAIAIKNHGGALIGAGGSNEGWFGADVRPPKQGENIWHHLMIATGYGMRNGRKYIKVLNSWGANYGDNGCNYIYEDYVLSGYLHRAVVLVDKANLKENLYRLVKEKGKPAVYVHDMFMDTYYGISDGEGIAGGDLLKVMSGDYKNANIIVVETLNQSKIKGSVRAIKE